MKLGQTTRPRPREASPHAIPDGGEHSCLRHATQQLGPRAAARSRADALAALCTLLFLTFLDNTVVSVGLGNMQTDLHASIADLQWVVGGYALAFASIMLACGMIGDELGRKKVMLSRRGRLLRRLGAVRARARTRRR